MKRLQQKLVRYAVDQPTLACMICDLERAGDLVLALMQLGLHDGPRTWKGYDWEVLDYLHERGFISNPASKAKSVVLTEEGEGRSRAMFEKYLARAA